MKTHKSRAACLIALLVVIALFRGPILDFLFVEKKPFHVTASQADGSKIDVSVMEVRNGLFISGGHGWSLGSINRTYSLTFIGTGRQIDWTGPGVPIVLQGDGSSFFLATYDRETDFPRTDFRCYKWKNKWMEIPTSMFPLRLTASNNLLKLGVESESIADAELRYSLLARFWFCVANNLHEWEVSDSDVSEVFVRSYREKLLASGK